MFFCFSAIWDKQFPTEKRDIPLLIHKNFPYWNFSERQKPSPRNFFGTVRLKVYHGKSWNSRIMHKIFGCPKFFESLDGSPRIFWLRETKTIDRIVIPLLSKKKLIPEWIWNKEGFAHDVFRRFGTKNFDGNTWHPLLIHIFSLLGTFLNTEGFAHDVFRRRETKNFRR